MNPLSLNRTLLWKEWRLNRWYFGTAMMLMSVQTMLMPVLYWIDMLVRPSIYRGRDMAGWSLEISNMFSGVSASALSNLGFYAAIGIGVLLVSQERNHNTLDFLVATPVSRREIIRAKFFVGAGVITAIMLINYIYIAGAAWMLPAKYTPTLAGKWFILVTTALLAVYSLSFFMATVTGTGIAAGIGAFGLIFSPQLMAGLVVLIAQSFMFDEGGAVHDTVSNIADHFTLPYYLPGSGFGFISNPWQTMYGPEALAMLAVFLGFYLLSVPVFEINPLEKNGQVFLFGDIRTLANVVLSFIAATVGMRAVFEVYRPGVPALIALFIGIFCTGYFVILLFFRLQRKLGFK